MILQEQEITRVFREVLGGPQQVVARPPVLPVSGRGSTGRAAVCSTLLMLQSSLAPNSVETTDLQYKATSELWASVYS